MWFFGKALTCGIQKRIKWIQYPKAMSSQSGFSNSLPPPGYPFYQVSCRYVACYISFFNALAYGAVADYQEICASICLLSEKKKTDK